LRSNCFRGGTQLNRKSAEMTIVYTMTIAMVDHTLTRNHFCGEMCR
jgi:hypothetical protein